MNRLLKWIADYRREYVRRRTIRTWYAYRRAEKAHNWDRADHLGDRLERLEDLLVRLDERA